MFINFARTLFEILVSDEFSYIKKIDNRLVYDTRVLSLYKDKGTFLYIVAIINAELITPDEYHELTNGFARISEGENRSRIILMNILVNDKERRLLREEDCLPEKNFYAFSYYVDLDTNSLEVPPEQPKLLDLDTKIQQAIANIDESYVNGTHLTSLENELSEKNALPTKSDNIYSTIFIILINIVVWLLMELSGGSTNTWTLISFGALSSNLIFNLNQYYRLFTSLFIHIGLGHLASNCLALYIYGSRVEKYFGKSFYLVIYLLSGLAGSIATVFFLSNLSAGASGAIFGLLGALLSITYRTGRSVSNLSPYVILLLCISAIGFGFLTPFTNNYAHIAGFITGAILGNVLYRRN